MRWEYHCEELVYEPDGTPDETLNQLGEQGWELVSVVDTGTVETDTGFNYFAFMFKRPKEENLTDVPQTIDDVVDDCGSEKTVHAIYLRDSKFGVFDKAGEPIPELERLNAFELLAKYAESKGYDCFGAMVSFMDKRGVNNSFLQYHIDGELRNAP